MSKPSDKSTHSHDNRGQLSLRGWNLFVRGLKRIAASVRNTCIQIALSPQLIRLRIRRAGAPLLDLPALPHGMLQRASKIVVLRLDRIGDGLLFSSFLRQLRTSAPKAEIQLVCSPAGFPVYEHCPYVNRVHVFEHGDPVYSPLARQSAKKHWQLYKAAKAFARGHLAPVHADVLLAPRFEVDNYGATYLAAFSRARLSISYSEKTSDIRRCINRGHDKLWSVIIPSTGVEHEVLRNAAFLDQIGGSASESTLEFWPTTEERETADSFLAHHRSKEGLVVLAPGASEPRKQWPAERFASVAQTLEDSGKDVLLIGSPADAMLCSSIAAQLRSPRVKDISGQFNLGSLFCLMQACSGFVGNDSGPAHLAAVAGIPVVVVSCHPKNGKDEYHQNPRRFGPWGVPHRVLQPQKAIPPCVDYCSALEPHCIAQISARDVVEAIFDLVINRRGAGDNFKAREQRKLCLGAPDDSR